MTFPSLVTPGLDLRVAAFTIAVSLLCGIAVGLAPWWQTRIVDLSTRLRESARTSDGPRSQRLRNGLVVAEVALAIVLMVGASLMIQSVRNLAAIDPGFDPASLLTVHISLPSRVPPPAGQVAAQTPPAPPVKGAELLEHIRGVPGVVAAGLGSDIPLDGSNSGSLFVAEGHTELTGQNRPRAWRHRVSPDFFDTLRIPIRQGPNVSATAR